MSDLDKKALEKLTKAELTGKVKSLKLKASSKATKDDLISLLLDNQPKAEKPVKAAKAEKPTKKVEPTATKKEEKELVAVTAKNNPKETKNQETQDFVPPSKGTTKKDDVYISEGYIGHKYSHFEQ